MTKKINVLFLIIVFIVSLANLKAISPKAALSIVKIIGKKFSIEFAQCGKYAGKLVNLSKKYGDELVKTVFKKSGPKGLVIAEKYGNDGIRAVSKYGDDAVRIISNGGGKEVVGLISKYGDDAVAVISRNPGSGSYTLKNLGKGVTKLSSENVVRAAAYHKDAVLKGMGTKFTKNFKKYGNNFIEFVKKNKGKFAIAGVYAYVKLSPDSELLPGLPNKKIGGNISKFFDFSLYIGIVFIFLILIMFVMKYKKILDFKLVKLKVDSTNKKKGEYNGK